MRHPASTTILFLLLCALLGGCAATAPPSGGSWQADLTQVKTGQADLSEQLNRLQNNLVLVEARVQDQEKAIRELQRILGAKKVTSGGEKTEPSPLSPGPSPPSATAEKTASRAATLYLKAFGDYTSGRFQAAVNGFEAFLHGNPDSDYAANAQYWLGECYYSLQQYERAVAELKKVVDSYPRAGRAPDALLGMAKALRKLNRPDRAQQALERLHSRYPDSPAARNAMEPASSP